MPYFYAVKVGEHKSMSALLAQWLSKVFTLLEVLGSILAVCVFN